MKYTPHTQGEVRQMLDAIGVSSIEGLFGVIPAELRVKSFVLPDALSEQQAVDKFTRLSSLGQDALLNFAGGGFYDHYIPSAVDHLSARSDFYTAYTPYQPECSQGWLQAIYEYQSAICAITGMDVSNASLYDAGTSVYEAVMVAVRVTGRRKVLVDYGLNPLYREMLRSYTANLGLEIAETSLSSVEARLRELEDKLDADTAAVIVQNPDFFGVVADYTRLIQKARSCKALSIVSAYPVSLGLIKTPGEMSADICIGEGQSLGIPLSFGGAYLGFMAVRSELARKIPGRIVGATVDKQGKRGFVLTLQAREQHIRREKATSNICSNEALCSLRAAIYLSLIGSSGLKELSLRNHYSSQFAKKLLLGVKGVKQYFDGPTFNEFTLKLPRSAAEVVKGMAQRGFFCGIPLGIFYKELDDCLLVAVTEKRTREEIASLADNLKEVI